MSTPDTIIAMIRERSERGLAKYGVTVDRTDLTFQDWVRHAQEEMLDGAQYLQRIAEESAAIEKRCSDEIKNAYFEGWHHRMEAVSRGLSIDNTWTGSRAKRIAEGSK